jgi:hypothetical protein
MTPDYEPARVQFSAENAELERLRIRSERMELMARAMETLAESRELLIKANEILASERIQRLAHLTAAQDRCSRLRHTTNGASEELKGNAPVGLTKRK